MKFETQLSGKWVLAGEHSVLRGFRAACVPYADSWLKMKFEPRSEPGLVVFPPDARAVIVELLQAFIPVDELPRGTLRIESTIPCGAGLGSSAALCIAISQWMSGDPAKVSEFATRLEDHFHGKSSGMDIATLLAAKPIAFDKSSGATPLGIKRLPRFTLHDTGFRSRTRDCVAHVENLLKQRPEHFERVDRRMDSAAKEAIEGLIVFDSGSERQGLALIGEAMSEAQNCFEEWQLVSDPIRRKRMELIDGGAVAAKLTGAGDGGMIVALWGV